MDILLDTCMSVIAKLLAKLGLELEVQKNDFLRFRITRGNSLVIFKNPNGFNHCVLSSTLYGMWNKLYIYQEIHYLDYVDGIAFEHAIVNPFLGCHSLDEVRIKIDLLAEPSLA